MSIIDVDAIIPRNPLEVCLPFAQELVDTLEFNVLRTHAFEREKNLVLEMNIALRALNYIRDYSVKTNLAFVLPTHPAPDEHGKIRIERLDLETAFDGDLIGARTLKINRTLGTHSVRAACLTFSNAIVRHRKMSGPDGRSMPVIVNRTITKDEQLYAPVFAINQIEEVI